MLFPLHLLVVCYPFMRINNKIMEGYIREVLYLETLSHIKIAFKIKWMVDFSSA